MGLWCCRCSAFKWFCCRSVTHLEWRCFAQKWTTKAAFLSLSAMPMCWINLIRSFKALRLYTSTHSDVSCLDSAWFILSSRLGFSRTVFWRHCRLSWKSRKWSGTSRYTLTNQRLTNYVQKSESRLRFVTRWTASIVLVKNIEATIELDNTVE